MTAALPVKGSQIPLHLLYFYLLYGVLLYQVVIGALFVVKYLEKAFYCELI